MTNIPFVGFITSSHVEVHGYVEEVRIAGKATTVVLTNGHGYNVEENEAKGLLLQIEHYRVKEMNVGNKT